MLLQEVNDWLLNSDGSERDNTSSPSGLALNSSVDASHASLIRVEGGSIGPSSSRGSAIGSAMLRLLQAAPPTADNRGFGSTCMNAARSVASRSAACAVTSGISPDGAPAAAAADASEYGIPGEDLDVGGFLEDEQHCRASRSTIKLPPYKQNSATSALGSRKATALREEGQHRGGTVDTNGFGSATAGLAMSPASGAASTIQQVQQQGCTAMTVHTSGRGEAEITLGHVPRPCREVLTRRNCCGRSANLLLPPSTRPPPSICTCTKSLPPHIFPSCSYHLQGSGDHAAGCASVDSCSACVISEGAAARSSEPSLTAAPRKPKQSLMKRMSMWGSGGAPKSAADGSSDRPSFMVRGWAHKQEGWYPPLDAFTGQGRIYAEAIYR